MSNILKHIEIKNYKCFESHKIYFNNLSIIVGQNNAGKSTLIETLRIISLVVERMRSTVAYINAPSWTNFGKKNRGISPSLSAIDVEIESENIFFRYEYSPAFIVAVFENGTIIKVGINKVKDEYEVFACGFLRRNNIKSRTEFRNIDLPSLYVLPQIMPLLNKEKIVTDRTLSGNIFSRKISRNFRTHLLNNKSTPAYKKFEELIEDTWTKIQIKDLFSEGEIVYLHIRDEDFTAEIYYMGHGLQMWLQTMWFISWIGENAIIVLDEPDVYMHPDLQRKLVRKLKNLSMQTVIASHSIEIISEVEPNNIVIINRQNDESVFTDNIPAVQVVLSNIGSVHNIALTRLINCKKYLYVEGEDIQILKRFYNTLFPDSKLPLDLIPSTNTGGWGGWNFHKESARKLRNEIDNLKIFFIFDSDYFDKETIEQRKQEAKSSGLNITIWKKKEIENYLLSSSAIARLILNNDVTLLQDDVYKSINEMMNMICEEMKEPTMLRIMDVYQRDNKGYSISKCKAMIEPDFKANWDKSKLSIVSGKEIISKLSNMCKEKFNVSFGATTIAAIMKNNEIDDEIKETLQQIEEA